MASPQAICSYTTDLTLLSKKIPESTRRANTLTEEKTGAREENSLAEGLDPAGHRVGLDGRLLKGWVWKAWCRAWPRASLQVLDSDYSAPTLPLTLAAFCFSCQGLCPWQTRLSGSPPGL